MTDIPPPPPPPPPPLPQPPGFGPGPSDAKNSLGVWALVLGILSVLCCGLVAGIPAIILGQKSKQAAAEGMATNGTLGNVGFILGIVGTALQLVWWIYALSTGTWSTSF